MTNEDPSLVRNYLGWINTRIIATQKRPRWASPEEKSKLDYKAETTLDTEYLALCYSLGEHLKDVKYRNAILCIIRYYAVNEGIFPSDRAVAIIYENTKKGSPARRMMVDFWAYAGNEGWLEGDSIRSDICPDFLEDLVPALLRARAQLARKDWPWADNADAYMHK